MDMDVLEKLQERRTVTLNDNINQEQAANLGHRLLELALESDEEIRLLIDSDGGNVQPALSICDVIASIKAPVIGIVIGRCFSMAVVILQACKKRMAAEHATFFLHHASSTFTFSQDLSEKEVRTLFNRCYLESKNSQAASEQVITSRTGRSAKDIQKMMHDGDALSARLNVEEAKAAGLIDGIIDNPLFSAKI
jgi:ATP-dependent protease ClpP protease subunit